MSKRLALLVLASACALAVSACGSSGGGIRVTNDGGAVFDFAGGSGDMATSPLPDLSTPPPDLSQLVDLTTPPDLSQPPGNCTAGRYSGAITAVAVGTPLTGTITFTLGPPQNGVLPVTTGKVTAMGQNMGIGLTATADVTGSLDCNGRSFSGMMVNGVVQPINFMFTGTLTADYNGAQRSFTNGMLNIQALMGTGTWSAIFLGP